MKLGLCISDDRISRRALGLRGSKWRDNGENSIMRGFLISHLAKYYEDGQIKEGEMKRAYSTHTRSAYKILMLRPE
jgi:hypothetical protein